MTTPIYFRLRKNSKRPVDCFTKVTKSKTVDMTVFNKGLRTGHVSNITAVDLTSGPLQRWQQYSVYQRVWQELGTELLDAHAVSAGDRCGWGG